MICNLIMSDPTYIRTGLKSFKYLKDMFYTNSPPVLFTFKVKQMFSFYPFIEKDVFGDMTAFIEMEFRGHVVEYDNHTLFTYTHTIPIRKLADFKDYLEIHSFLKENYPEIFYI